MSGFGLVVTECLFLGGMQHDSTADPGSWMCLMHEVIGRANLSVLGPRLSKESK